MYLFLIFIPSNLLFKHAFKQNKKILLINELVLIVQLNPQTNKLKLFNYLRTKMSEDCSTNKLSNDM